MTGAEIMLETGMQAARDGLADLAGSTWIMSLPQRQAAYHGHPAGRGRPGLPADEGTGLVAVTFGNRAVLAQECVILSVRWEPMEPGDEFTVLLDGSVTLAPAAAPEQSVMTLTGTCETRAGAMTPDACEQLSRELSEASREFITNVADDVTHAAGSGPERGQLR